MPWHRAKRLHGLGIVPRFLVLRVRMLYPPTMTIDCDGSWLAISTGWILWLRWIISKAFTKHVLISKPNVGVRAARQKKLAI